MNKLLVIVPSPIPELHHALLPLQNVVSEGVCLDSLLFRCFQFRLTFESIKEFGGASISHYYNNIFAIHMRIHYFCFNYQHIQHRHSLKHQIHGYFI